MSYKTPEQMEEEWQAAMAAQQARQRLHVAVAKDMFARHFGSKPMPMKTQLKFRVSYNAIKMYNWSEDFYPGSWPDANPST